MSFPSDIAERALLDCSRHCCICHKFCGFKIELHHIKPVAEDGEDTYENCIPLCLDCHAEVKAYDPKHPKGRKYTESELRGHRDRWYERVRKSHGITTNPDYIELDRKLFLEIRGLLPSTGSIEFARSHDYGDLFRREAHSDLWDFLDHCRRPEFEFIDTDLEGLRAELADCIKEFRDMIGQYTFPYERQDDFSRVTPYWDPGVGQAIGFRAQDESQFEEMMTEYREHYHKIVRDLNDLSIKICSTYDELIRLGRRKLGV